MRFTLKDYQDRAVRSVLERLEDAKDDYRNKDRQVAFALSAITGAGKTVMASAVFEALFDGAEDLAIDGDPSAVVLWVTDDPNLNEQTRFRIMEASDRLDSSRLRIIGDGFDVERLDAGKVYFLNRQKLTGKTFITPGNGRTYTLWETIKSTIEDPARTLYLVLDEAHIGVVSNGAKEGAEEDRSTTKLRLINGHEGAPPAPIVWGISATVERFSVAMKHARDRTTLPNVIVDNAAVQASGLLKDTISLDLPDQAGSFATVLAREASLATREASLLWDVYAEQESLPEPVHPLLVVQVPNKPSTSEIASLLDTIYGAWPELPADAVANVFGDHTNEQFGKHAVPYILPQDVQDATHIRVLLAKDAISTGWDCPRAETLLSLRPAKDQTHITQLLGRLVRTPLARRIDSDERLNAVTCFLPHFDAKTAKSVADVITGVKSGDDGSPSGYGRVLIDPATMLWNEAIPSEVREILAALPSEVTPKTPMRPIKRLLSMAAELAVDELAAEPNIRALNDLYGVLDGQAAQHKELVEAKVDGILTADIKRITANRLSLESTETIRQVEADEQTVDDAYRAATRIFGAALANGYAKKLALARGDDDDDFDIYTAKAAIAALALTPGVIERVEDAASRQIDAWFAEHHASIKALNEERRSAYDAIKQQAKEPQEVDLVVPVSRIEMTNVLEGDKRIVLPVRDRHVLADEAGDYPVGKLRDWEITVLDTEMNRKNAVAWYRNPSSPSKDAVQVPWKDGDRWRSMQPDFIFFSRRAQGDLVASIVDPHGHHLNDALGKLLGLADFAEKYKDRLLRVEAVSKDERGDLSPNGKGTLRLLDLTNPRVRKVVRSSASAADAYRDAGTKYE